MIEDCNDHCCLMPVFQHLANAFTNCNSKKRHYSVSCFFSLNRLYHTCIYVCKHTQIYALDVHIWKNVYFISVSVLIPNLHNSEMKYSIKIQHCSHANTVLSFFVWPEFDFYFNNWNYLKSPFIYSCYRPNPLTQRKLKIK